MAAASDCYVYCAGSVFGTLLMTYVLKKFFAFLVSPRTPKLTKDYPKDKVLLHQMGRGKYAPSLSPFPMKLETYFRMAKIPYETTKDKQMSSKGKTPWMEYNGKAIPDSQFCIDFLNKERGIDLNKGLSNEQRAVARALLKMTEENLYWSLVWYRWVEEKGDSVAELSGGAIPKLLIKMWLGKVARVLFDQGFGRHTKEEKLEITRGDLEALSVYLGSKKFMMGDEPCEVDCGIFGMLAQLVWHMPGSPHLHMVNNDFKNLKEYCYRMKEKFWPDWNDCVLSPDVEGKKDL